MSAYVCTHIVRPGPGRNRTSIAELLADERCSQAVLATTDVGRTADPPVAEDGEAAASEGGDRKREERLALLREEEVRLVGGGAGVIFPLSFFYHTPGG